MLSYCLDREDVYNIVTSLFCYRLLVPHFSTESEIYWYESFTKENYTFLATSANDAFPVGYSLVPDIDDAKNIEKACAGLTRNDCQRWLSCSRTARDCCKKYRATNSSKSATELYCKATWDGVACFDDTPNGTVVHTECPSFYIPTTKSVNVSKTCLSSGEWKEPKEEDVVVDGVLNNYHVCQQQEKKVVGLEAMEIQRLVTLVTNLISLTFLLPSMAIVIFFRSSGNTYAEVKSRRMFRIHMHFFLSLILVSVITLIWDNVFAKEHLGKINTKSSLIEMNSLSCKILYCLQKYFRSTTYFWMFAEGLNVFLPLYQRFEKEIKIPWLYFLGWGVPFFTTAIYATLRASIQRFNFKCWVYVFPETDWIIWGPNYITVLCNFIFLIVIVVKVVNKGQDAQITSTVIPKPVRPLIFLIPLFGVNFIFVWISYGSDSDWPFILDRAVEGLQGFFVCILSVGCNKQVQDNVKIAARRRCLQFFLRFKGRKFRRPTNTHLAQ